jgi:hypothetical protein
MSNNADRLKKLNQRIERLIASYTAQQLVLEQSKLDLSRLKQELDKQQELSQELQHKIKVIRLAHSIEPDVDRAELKRKINEYLREIDHCIGLLND